MKIVYNHWRELLQDCIIVVFVCGTIGIALKFVTFFNQWVYFPLFPNVLDSTFLISGVLFLAWKSRARR